MASGRDSAARAQHVAGMIVRTLERLARSEERCLLSADLLARVAVAVPQAAIAPSARDPRPHGGDADPDRTTHQPD
jgi:hypothetical protein